MSPPIPSLAELERQLARAESVSQRRLLVAVVRVRQGIPLGAIERALVAQRFDEAVRLVGLEPILNAVAGVSQQTDLIRQLGWWEALRGLPATILRQQTVLLSLGAASQQSPSVLERIALQDLSRIREVNARTVQAIRDHLTAGLSRGAPPIEVARQLRQVVGLTTRQAQRVERYRVQLVAEGRPADQVDRMVDRFSHRQLAQRTENIARTETMTALQGGKTAQWERLKQEGTLADDDWEQEWVTAADERTCPLCEPLHGARAAIGGQFTGTDGVRTGPPPRHPRCRCIARLVLRGFRRGQAPAPARDRILLSL